MVNLLGFFDEILIAKPFGHGTQNKRIHKIGVFVVVLDLESLGHSQPHTPLLAHEFARRKFLSQEF